MSGAWVAGVDEAGRGPLAGPVVVAAVVLDENDPIAGLADSKRLSAGRREALSQCIRSRALAWCVARASVAEIDALNILHATFLAMQRAVSGLGLQPPGLVLVDGNRCPSLSYDSRAVVKGDATVACISAASILAKVARDEDMLSLHERHPEYDFATHKGYPTLAHMAALQRHGASACHRRSFGPVRRALRGEAS